MRLQGLALATTKTKRPTLEKPNTRENKMNKCERCECQTTTTIVSMFNTQVICMNCKKREAKHPDYKKACDAELAEVKKGNRNFEGIGLPSDIVNNCDYCC